MLRPLHQPLIHQRETRAAARVRLLVGLIWLAGAVFNALVTLRMTDPYGWLVDESPFRVYQWFFDEVVGAHPEVWTALLIGGETSLGILTLTRGRWARLGLVGGALFSAVLFLSGTPYTLMMGPYALLLAWLAAQADPHSVVDTVRRPR